MGAVVTGRAVAEDRRREGMNTLYFGDNLEVLRESIADRSVDLVYLDPPFNSGANYNIIFQPEKKSAAKATGSIYLHCDPTASHYLKLLMDAVFGVDYFRNEIVWHYSGWNKGLKHHFERRHDIVLFYGKGESQQFNSFYVPYESRDQYLRTRKQKVRIDTDGRAFTLDVRDDGKRQVRVYVDDALNRGRPTDDVWSIDKLNNSAKEALGYPTQKPQALLERIIQASSNEGDVVLDPFCGCGTAVAAAQKL